MLKQIERRQMSPCRMLTRTPFELQSLFCARKQKQSASDAVCKRVWRKRRSAKMFFFSYYVSDVEIQRVHCSMVGSLAGAGSLIENTQKFYVTQNLELLGC